MHIGETALDGYLCNGFVRKILHMTAIIYRIHFTFLKGTKHSSTMTDFVSKGWKTAMSLADFYEVG